MSETSDFKRIIRIVVLPLLVLLVGALGAFALFKAKPKAKRAPVERAVPAVDVALVKSESHTAKLTANGTVTAKREVTLSPEVAGRIRFVSENLETGGSVKAGEILIKIEATDFSVARELDALRVENAKADLALEQGRADLAAREVKLLGKGARDENSLALRGPQKRKAEIALKSAEAQLRRSSKNLSRTSLRAPFNALVKDENVEVGTYASPQLRAATLIGTDAFYVEAAIPVDKLSLLKVPEKEGEGSKVQIIQELGTSRSIREGRVVRLAGTLDAETRTAKVIIEVKAPMTITTLAPAPLFPDAFVTVDIEGGEGRDVIAIPESAIISGDRVYVVDDGNRLAMRRIFSLWKSAGKAYLKTDTEGGLVAGERVIVSPLANPIAGTQVRIRRTLDDKAGVE